MERSPEQVCLFCEEEGPIIITMGNGKSVRLCGRHFSVWRRRNMGDVEVSPDALLGVVDDGYRSMDAILDRARAGMAAEMLG